MNSSTWQTALAFMGVVIGGGFASGQEIIQFFTGFGILGVAGTLVSMVLFAFLGMQVARIGALIRARSHKDVLYAIFGQRIGWLVDLLLSFFLFGVGVAMLAGSGSIFSQEYGLSPVFGGSLMCVLVILTLCLNVRSIINSITLVMPFLIALVLIVTVYSMTTNNADTEVLNAAAQGYDTAASHWLVSAVLYASFNIAVGFPMLSVIGGRSGDAKVSARGGLWGGLGLGALIILLNVGMFANLNQLAGIEMPTLALAAQISPLLGVLMSVALVCMVYSTAVGMFFAFTTRFAVPDTTSFKWLGSVFCLIGLGLSFVGFSKLIGTVYPLLGYVGFALIVALGISWVKARSSSSVALPDAD